jgi:hypothetical protein
MLAGASRPLSHWTLKFHFCLKSNCWGPNPQRVHLITNLHSSLTIPQLYKVHHLPKLNAYRLQTCLHVKFTCFNHFENHQNRLKIQVPQPTCILTTSYFSLSPLQYLLLLFRHFLLKYPTTAVNALPMSRAPLILPRPKCSVIWTNV